MHIIHIDAFKYVDGFKATDIYKNKECHKNSFAVLIYSVVSCAGSYRTLSLSILSLAVLDTRGQTSVTLSSHPLPLEMNITVSLTRRALCYFIEPP